MGDQLKSVPFSIGLLGVRSTSRVFSPFPYPPLGATATSKFLLGWSWTTFVLLHGGKPKLSPFALRPDAVTIFSYTSLFILPWDARPGTTPRTVVRRTDATRVTPMVVLPTLFTIVLRDATFVLSGGTTWVDTTRTDTGPIGVPVFVYPIIVAKPVWEAIGVTTEVTEGVLVVLSFILFVVRLQVCFCSSVVMGCVYFFIGGVWEVVGGTTLVQVGVPLRLWWRHLSYFRGTRVRLQFRRKGVCK